MTGHIANIRLFPLPFVVVAILVGCQTMKPPVPSQEIFRVEVSDETSGILTFRIDCLANSFLGIGAYNFEQEKNDSGRNLYLSIYRAKNKSKGITEYLNRGVEIVIPFSDFDKSKDKCWYKDAAGRYLITVGTAQGWDAYIKKKYGENAIMP